MDDDTNPFEHLTLPQLQAATVTGAAEFVNRCLSTHPAAIEYRKTGWGLACEVKLWPAPAQVMVSFIDPADGQRIPAYRVELPVVLPS